MEKLVFPFVNIGSIVYNPPANDSRNSKGGVCLVSIVSFFF